MVCWSKLYKTTTGDSIFVILAFIQHNMVFKIVYKLLIKLLFDYKEKVGKLAHKVKLIFD